MAWAATSRQRCSGLGGAVDKDVSGRAAKVTEESEIADRQTVGASKAYKGGANERGGRSGMS